MSKKIEKDNKVTVSEIYETLKSPNFLKNLYWDILKDIRKKDTYKFIRGMAEELIHKNMNALENLTESESDNVFRKTLVAQICSMSYAIDTVFSKILYMKLEKACKLQIVDIINELKIEGKISDDIWSNFEFNREAQVSNCSETANKSTVKKEGIKKPVGRPLRKRKQKILEPEAASYNDVIEDIKKINGVDSANNRPKISGKRKANLPKKKLGGRIKEFSKRDISAASTSTLIENSSDIDIETVDDSDACMSKNSLQDDNQDASDAESDISVGHASLASVSSVHTSDLSSFDDEISLSSDDESGKKKRLSLKELQKKFCENGNLDSSITEKSTGTKLPKSSPLKEKIIEKAVENKIQENEVLPDATANNTSETSSLQSLNEKDLPKRARKPNSRYSSVNILCTSFKVKERKKFDVAAVNKTSDKTSSDELSPQSKKLKIDTALSFETSIKAQPVNKERSSIDLDVKGPVKQHESSDLFKPHSTIRPLTSRKTSAVTLFSTP